MNGPPIIQIHRLDFCQECLNREGQIDFQTAAVFIAGWFAVGAWLFYRQWTWGHLVAAGWSLKSRTQVTLGPFFIDADRIYLFLNTVYVKIFQLLWPHFYFSSIASSSSSPFLYFHAYKAIGLNGERGRIVSKLFKSFSFSLSNILPLGHTLWQHWWVFVRLYTLFLMFSHLFFLLHISKGAICKK